MKLQRREFLLFFGATVGAALLRSPIFAQETTLPTNPEGINFKPVKLPIPLNIDNLTPQEQITAYQTYTVEDDLILPEGFQYDVIASWGDPIGDSRFGYNNDYVAFIPTNDQEGLLVINFEYISGNPWITGYQTGYRQRFTLY